LGAYRHFAIKLATAAASLLVLNRGTVFWSRPAIDWMSWHQLIPPLCYIGEIGPYLLANRGTPNVGPRISILDHKGKLLGRLGTIPSAGIGPGQFISPHGIAVDSRGDIYVGEVSYTGWPSLFPGQPIPKGLRCLQKFIKVSEGAN
jgi:hypothetical protein